ncbi:MAG: uncharacterized protein QOG43_91 [Actinomycetota bacterium]|nr:uncharacterized protein [Actinomycetota bacterium]
MYHWPLVVLAGFAIGLLMGFFGVGGASVATPLLAILGIPPLAAVASPLPATIPGAAIAASAYLRSGEARPRAAAWTLAGGVPGTILGAVASQWVGGRALLVASGVVLIVVGFRVVRPIDDEARAAGTRRRLNRPLLVGATAGVGLLTGLLANGGGFLLVPLYVLFFGLRMRPAVGTSLVVITVLAIPTLVTHWTLGHVDWAVAGLYGVGALPASALGSVLSRKVAGPLVRRAFGWFLIAFGVLFTFDRLLGGG